MELDKNALIRALFRVDVPANNDVLTWSNNLPVWAAAPGAAGGEANTASNQGVGGVGVFKQKTLVDLEFKNINAGSSKITVTDDSGNNEIDIDADPDNIMPGTTKGDIIVHNGTAHTRLAVGTDTHVLTANSTAASGVEWAAPSGGGGGFTLVGPKGSDQTSITSTSLADITGLTFAASANTNYFLRAVINWSSTNSTEGVRLAFNGPTGTYSYWGLISETDANQDGDGFALAADTAVVCNSGTAASERFAILEGLIQVGGSGGTIAARVAAETGSGASCTIHAESFLVYQTITT